MGNWAYFFFSSKIPSEVYWIWAKQGFWEDWNQFPPSRPHSLSKDVWTGISSGASINPLIKILLGELREKRSQFSNIVKLLATPPGARASPDAETTLHLCSSWNLASPPGKHWSYKASNLTPMFVLRLCSTFKSLWPSTLSPTLSPKLRSASPSLWPLPNGFCNPTIWPLLHCKPSRMLRPALFLT